ncbi:hypothetical protein A7982_12419 [Minicystis rosea]|nr:hypothetical protein A7982_12419 [Minicystis rosea]
MDGLNRCIARHPGLAIVTALVLPRLGPSRGVRPRPCSRSRRHP